MMLKKFGDSTRGRGEFAGRELARKRNGQRWLKKTWKRRKLKLKDKFDPLEGACMAKGIVIEKKVLEQLVARRLVEVFKNAKYKEGVYNISQKVYAAVAASSDAGSKEYVPAAVAPEMMKRSAPAPPCT